MSDYIDIYGPDGQLIYRRPRYMEAGAPADVAKRASPPGAVARTSMAAEAAGFGSGLTPGAPPPPLITGNAAPRQYQYPYGYNYPTRPRASEKISFQTLRDFSQLYDVARMCIETRQDELRGLDWDIVPVEEGQGISDQYKDEIKAIRKFFDKPDRSNTFDAWINALAEDWLAIDALTIFKRRTRKGELYSLEFVDGATIKPLLDGRGRVPVSPDPAFEQYIQGMVETQYTSDDLIYRPHRVRSYSPYGLSPMEWLLLTINVDLKLQYKFLMWFTEGNIPAAFGEVPETWNPAQVQEWQTMWDAWLQGDEAAKAQIKWVPKANIKTTGDPVFETKFPEFLLKKTCAAYKVAPQELGFTADVNRSTGQSQENIQYRRSIKPTADFFESIFTDVIQTELKQPLLKFKFLGIHPDEDSLKLAQVDEINIRNGVISPDEVRERNGQQVDLANPVGRLFMTVSGPVFVDQLKEAAAKPQEGPPQGAPAEKPPVEGQPAAEPPGTGDKAPLPDKGARASDLRKWQRKALDRAKAGRRPACEFASPHISEAVKTAIVGGLSRARTQEDVRAVFAKQATDSDKPKLAPPKRPRRALKKEQKAMTADLHTFLKSEGEKLAATISEAPDAVSALVTYDWGTWTQVQDLVAPRLEAVHVLGGTAALESLKAVGTWDLKNEPAIQYAQSRAAELVGKRTLADGTVIDNPNAQYNIAESTRTFLQAAVTDAVDQGMSTDDLRDEILSEYAFSEGRAATIARTETAIAYNAGTIDGYRQTGLVDMVEVMDGDSDPECAEANGQVWTLEEADANPIEHPNCVRAFSPVLNDEGGDA